MKYKDDAREIRDMGAFETKFNNLLLLKLYIYNKINKMISSDDVKGCMCVSCRRPAAPTDIRLTCPWFDHVAVCYV